MMRVVHAGNHELRVVAVEPVLVYIRFAGDVTIAEARALSQIVGRHTSGRDSRILVSASGLGTIPPDSRRELVTAGQNPNAGSGYALDVIFVQASMLQKVMLAQVLSMASLPPKTRVQTHFFDALDDALAWLGLPRSLLSDQPEESSG